MRHTRWQTWGLAWLLLALLAMPSSGASESGRRWTRFTRADGLPSETVWAIAVSPGRGDVWLGTTRGASLYRDGRWYSYSPEHGLGAEWVAALAVDSQERVWFGTFGGGLTVLDDQGWQAYTAANSGLAGDWISALATGPQGQLWCGTWGRGLSLFDSGRWQSYSSGNSALPADYVTALAVGPDGALWAGLHGQGLARLAAGRWTHYGVEEGLADDFVTALALAPNGDLWVGTARGMNRLDGQGRVQRTYGAADGLPDDQVQALATDAEGRLWVGTARGAAVLEGEQWTVYRGHATLAHDYVSAIAAAPEGVWLGSFSAGVARYGSGAATSARRLPVVLVHGWHGPESDRLEDSEFRFLAGWLHDDGYPVYYAEGISPKNTLHQNAARLRAVIERARRESGTAKVDVIAFSMGGLNTRAYLESSLYAGDVDQAFILGTPQAGIRLWYPFLLRELHERARDPSAVELTPEYAGLFNALHHNGAGVPYTLIVGDARGPELPETLRGLPPGDALVSAGSALALEGPHVRRIVTDDLHAWSDETILLGLPSLLWPRRTYDAHIRNRLRLGPEAQLPGLQDVEPPSLPLPEAPPHSPFYGGEVAPGEAISETVTVDAPGEVHFYLRSYRGDLSFSLIDPQGTRVDEDSIGERGEHFDLGLAGFQSYLVRHAQAGDWTVVVERPENAHGAARFTGYAVLSSGPRLSVSAAPAGPGEGVAITATLEHEGEPLPRARLEVEIGRPDMQVGRLVLFDDGEHGDREPHDGVYGATYRPPRPGGYYTLFVTARGTVAGAPFARTAETLFAISPDTARLNDSYAEAPEDTNRNGRFDFLALQVGVDVRAAGDYLLAATLLEAEGREIGRVVEPMRLDAGSQTATLRFPGRMLLQAGVDGPYTVGRVALLDETGAAILLQEATGVLQTRPYRYQDFEGS